MKPDNYYRLTFREYLLMREGYENEAKIRKEYNLEAWRRARLIAYNAALPYMKDPIISMWEFMPLEGDPNKEELEQMRKDQINQMEKQALEMIEYYKNRKYLA